ncbi:MAG: MFS transporter [Gammaproteobacteria bacterium]|nr:MFS transporter [Gammaproteobacteria bacterium]
MSNNSQNDSSPMRAWTICITAALGLFFIFFQMHAFNSLSSDLMKAFKINESQLGIFSIIFLLSNGLSLIPVSFLIDKFSIKKAIVAGMVCSIISLVVFASAQSIYIAGIARALGGISQSFVFLGCLRLVAKWLEDHLALANSVVITIGLFGAIAAQTPLTLLISAIGWRPALLVIAGLTTLITVVILFVVKDKQSKKSKPEASSWSEVGGKLKEAFVFPQNWLCAAYTTFLNLPIVVLGGLLGNIYLKGAENLDAVQASSIITLLYAGSMIGGPIIGLLSDKMGQRRPLMFICPVLGIIVILAISIISGLGNYQLAGLFFALGLFSSSQALAYPILTECNLTRLASISLGFACAVSTVMNSFLQSGLAASLSSSFWKSLSINPFDQYRSTMLLFAVIFLAGIIVTLFIRETYCKIADQ